MSVFRFLKEPQVGLRERVKAVEVLSIFGQAGGARFGSAVSSLGDLDGDGLGDFAVGSPYEDQGQGSVRIYFGSKKITSIQGDDVMISHGFFLNHMNSYNVPRLFRPLNQVASR